MIVPRVFAPLLLALGASAQQFGCGTADPDSEHIGMSKVLAAQEARRGGSGNLTERATINVGVYFHVVAQSQTVAGGYLTVGTNCNRRMPILELPNAQLTSWAGQNVV